MSDVENRATYYIQLLSDCLEIVRAKPSESETQLAAGKIYEIADVHQEAISHFEQSVNADCNNFEALARLSLALLKAGRTQEALQYAVELNQKASSFTFLSLGGKTVSAPAVLGDALQSAGKFELAVEAFREALEVSSEDRYSAAMCAAVLLRLGKTTEAVQLVPRFESSVQFVDLVETLKMLSPTSSNLPALARLSFKGDYYVERHI